MTPQKNPISRVSCVFCCYCMYKISKIIVQYTHTRCRFCWAIWRFSSPKIAENRGRKSPNWWKSGPKTAKNGQKSCPNDANHPQLLERESTVHDTDPRRLFWIMFILFFSSSIEIIYWSLKSSFWRDFRRRKPSNNIHFRPLMKQMRPLHKIGP